MSSMKTLWKTSSANLDNHFNWVSLSTMMFTWNWKVPCAWQYQVYWVITKGFPRTDPSLTNFFMNYNYGQGLHQYQIVSTCILKYASPFRLHGKKPSLWQPWFLPKVGVIIMLPSNHHYAWICVCVCVRACACACVRACTCMHVLVYMCAWLPHGLGVVITRCTSSTLSR